MIKITENGKNHEKCQKSAKMPKIKEKNKYAENH